MKKRRISLVVVMAFFIVLSAVHFGKLDAMAYETKEIEMEMFEERKLKTFSNYENVEWETDDDDIVYTKNGILYAKCPGKTSVIATSGDDPETSETIYRYKVTVKSPKCKLEGKNIKLNVGDEEYVDFYIKNIEFQVYEFNNIKYYDYDIDDFRKGFERLSSNKSVAYVDKDGLIHAKKVGTTYITLKIAKKKYKFKVTVKKKKPSFSKIYKKMKAFEKRGNKKYLCGKINGKVYLTCVGQYNWERGITKSYLGITENYLKYYQIYPYIGLVKKKGKPVLNFGFDIIYGYKSPNYYNLNPKNFYIYSYWAKLKTNKFEYKKTTHKFKDGMYENVLHADAIILSTEYLKNRNNKKISLVESILNGDDPGSKITVFNENGMHDSFMYNRKDYYCALYRLYEELLDMYI